MATQKTDRRFYNLLDKMQEFDDKMDKLRRVKNFLTKEVMRAWKESAQMNLEQHRDLVVRMPIGALSSMQVEVSFDKQSFLSRTDPEVRMRILDLGGGEITESNITLPGLENLALNPNSAIDAAAEFCDRLGCLTTFKGRIGRLCLMDFNL